MKRLNVKLLLILAGSAVAFAVLVFFVHRWQVARNADSLVRRADEARQAGDYEEAAEIRARYLKHRPNDKKQRWQFASDLAALTDMSDKERIEAPAKFRDAVTAALRAYDYAVREDSENAELRRELIDFALKFGMFKDAREHIQILLKSEEGANDTELKVLLARCQVGDKPHEAVNMLRDLLGYDEGARTFSEDAPAQGQVDAYTNLAALYRQTMLDPENADVVMDFLVQKLPESPEAQLAYGRYLLQHHSDSPEKRELAHQAISKAFELSPDDEATLIAAAEVAMNADDFGRAAEILQQGLQKFPESEQVYHAKAQLALRQEDADKAMEELTTGLKKIPGSGTLLWMQANLQLQNQDLDAVDKTIGKLRESLYQPRLIEYLEAQVLLSKEAWIKAVKKLERLRPQMAGLAQMEQRVDRDLVRCYENLGQFDRALEVWNRMLTERPGDLVAVQGKIRALNGLQRFDEARDWSNRLERALEGSGRIADSDLARRDLGVKLREQLQKPADERSWVEVDQALARYVSIEGVSEANKRLAQIEVMQRKGELEKVRQYVRQSRQEFPEVSQLWQLDVQLTVADKGPEAALAIVDEMEAQFGDSVGARLIRAGLYLQLEGAQAKGRVLALAKNTDDFSPQQKVTLWRGLSQYLLRLGDFPAAKSMLAQSVEGDPNNLKIRMELFDLNLQAGDDQGMVEALAQVADAVGKDSAEWMVLKATHLLWRKETQDAGVDATKRARELLDEAAEKRDTWQRLALVDAELRLIEGNTDEAIRRFEQALELGRTDPRVVRRLVRMLAQRGQFEDASRFLQLIDEESRTDDDQRIDLQIALEQGAKVDEIVAKGRKNYDPDSPLSSDHLWFGRLLASAGQNEEAEAVLRKTVDLGPSNSESWITLVRFLASVGKTAQAEEVLRDAQLALPMNELPLVMGQCYEFLGQFYHAQHHYLMALESDPDNLSLLRNVTSFYLRANRVQEARKYLNRMLRDAKPNETTINPHVAWARRAMAQVLAASNSYQDYLEAQKLIRANVPQGGELPREDLLLSVQLAAKRPDPLSRQQAIQLLERTQDKRELSDDEKLVLGRLYERADRWIDCQTVMGELVARNADNDQIVATYCEMLLRNDQADQVGPWLDNLNPNSLAAVQIRAHMLVEQGREQDAVKLLLSKVPNPLPPEQVTILRSLSELLERLEQYEIAEKLMRAYVRRQPQQTLMLAAYLGRRGKLEEAFKLMEEARDNQSIVAITQIANDSLTRLPEKDPSSKYFQQAREWFEAGRRDFPDSKAILMQLAIFEDMCGNSDRVVEIYRTYLARKDTRGMQRAIVQNNLAYMLALIALEQKRTDEEPLALIEASIRTLGPTPDLVDTLAMAQLAAHQPIKAIQALTQAIASEESASKHFHLALAEHMNRNRQRAESALTKAVEIGLVREDLAPTEQLLFDRLCQDLKFNPAAVAARG